ncbi:EamA-like transporter family protein [Sulfitobacter marinus]|uniref:EamA-like transporter family protein n=1 Tax=Sulfitobacter marinus TaxID=394264 RepID=A0A1I6RV87_9RHOB|nr:DMT family transporter [Sulfitobacter marinus]SFS68490.1 EamA-like transporter family protein [Sulfitobacter marinus]
MTFVLPDLWILVTLAAAIFQTARFMLQKYLATATLSAAGATFSRFLYSAPFIVGGLAVYLGTSGTQLPQIGSGFWAYGLLGGTAQILATVCVVLLFKQRNFAVGITFKKTEVILTVLTGWLILGEGVTIWGFAAIGLGVVGLLLLSAKKGENGFRLRDMGNKAAGLGIASGFLFAISAVTYRGATLAVMSDMPVLRAGVTLAAVVCMQAAIMAVYLRLREPGQMSAVWQARKVAVWIGLMSLGGSLCWFIAFTLQNAAYVKALGQVELILSVAASTLFFREKITGREWAGMAVLISSILMLVLVA